MTSQVEVLTISKVFRRARYVVPVYQRAYAWRDDEIVQLLTDVRDARRRASDYYIGTLVVHRPGAPHDHDYEVVDGQQRLTTLALILSHPRVRAQWDGQVSLTYEGRPDSQDDLLAITEYSTDYLGDDQVRQARDVGIHHGVGVIRRELAIGSKGHAAPEQFSDEDIAFLLSHVHIVRAELPEGTDLNHYFEIMNSRGEQLHKHEIVKAGLLSHSDLTDSDRRAMTTIWDACADLTRYVQQGFPPDRRTDLFGSNWDQLRVYTVDDLFGAFAAPDGTHPTNHGAPRTLGDLLAGPQAQGEAAADGEAGRYGAIIDFPNFLLQALKLHVARRATGAQRTFSWERPDSTVPLDDKRLIDEFSKHISSAEEARSFLHSLLVTRFLFDNYVIKTDPVHDSTEDDSNWVLKRPHKTGSGAPKLSPRDTFGEHLQGDADEWPTDTQRRVMMLQSMFQVTDSRRAYKNFLTGILEVLWLEHDNGTIDGERFADDLEELAEARSRHLLSAGHDSALDAGTAVPHYIFNYLDYALWRGITTRALTATDLFGPDGSTAPPVPDVGNYRFRYRKSIEHFYPVQPSVRDGQHTLAHEDVNLFGNLCIMTSSENSRRNNLAATAKAAQFLSSGETLKFQLMAAVTQSEHEWNLPQIRRHGARMRNVLNRGLRG